jgi:hypothetical protein
LRQRQAVEAPDHQAIWRAVTATCRKCQYPRQGNAVVERVHRGLEDKISRADIIDVSNFRAP